jgi:hypothetical protein
LRREILGIGVFLVIVGVVLIASSRIPVDVTENRTLIPSIFSLVGSVIMIFGYYMIIAGFSKPPKPTLPSPTT